MQKLVERVIQTFKLPLRKEPFKDINVFMTFISQHSAKNLEFRDHLLYYRSLGEAMYKEYMYSLFMWYNWAVYGLPVFKIDEDAFAGFALTDPGVVDDICLPYPAFVIDVPRHFWYTESLSSGFETDMVLITVSVLWTPTNEDLTQPIRSVRYKINFEDGTELYYLMPYDGFLSSETYIGNVDPHEQKQLETVRNIIINLATYIENNKKDVKKARVPIRLRKARARRAKKRKKTLKTSPTIWFVGREVKLDRKVIEEAKTLITRKKWQVKSRFTVRGHWRRQPYGPGKKKIKRIWIKPHWKGPKGARRLSHLYTVEGDE